MENFEHSDYQLDNIKSFPITEDMELQEAKTECLNQIEMAVNEYHNETLSFEEQLIKNKIEKYVNTQWFINVGYNSYKLQSTTSANNMVEIKNKNEEQKTKEKFIKYIMDGKLGSGEDSSMENIYNKLVYHNNSMGNIQEGLSPSPIKNISQVNFGAWRLKYIMDNKGRNLLTIIKEIEEKQESMMTMAKRIDGKKIDLLPQVVKQLLPKGYPLFIQGRSIVVNTLNGVTTELGEHVGGIDRFFKPKSKIKSAPKHTKPYIDEKTGEEKTMTLCSQTAQENAKSFGIIIPGGNAREGVQKEAIDLEHFIETKQGKDSTIQLHESAPTDANYADLSIGSDTANGRKYGHRAAAFKDNTGQRYILDPYYSGGKGRLPIPIENYPKNKRIEIANYYNAPIQSKSA